MNLKDFGRFCRSLTLENGKSLKLEIFQKEMLAEYFEGAIETVIVVPKKNGKTTLLAALALYHLKHWGDAECVIGASSRDQATILFNQAAGLIRRSGLEETFAVKTGYREIRLVEGAGRVRVLAADAATADGVIPTLALVDELHRHLSGELYGTFRDGLGPRKGQMITISTAGWDKDSALGVLREKAHDMDGFTRDGAHNHAISPDGGFVWHEWCLEDTDDLSDMELVKSANPAPWHTVTALRRRHDSPSTTPPQWSRFACGVWTAGESPWLRPDQWDSLDRDSIADGGIVYMAVDYGTNPAVAMAAPREDGKVAVSATILEGDVPLEVVERTIMGLARRYEVQEVAYQPGVFNRSADLLGVSLAMQDIPHSTERMSAATGALYRTIMAGELLHSGDPTLRSHVLSGITKETQRGWHLMKSQDSRGLIALAFAVQRATEVAPEAPGFVSLGVG